MDKQHIALRLRTWQDSIGMPTGILCKIINIPENTWYRYRTGKHLPQPHYLVKLAQTMDLDIHWLYTGESRPATDHAAQPAQRSCREEPLGTTRDLWAR